MAAQAGADGVWASGAGEVSRALPERSASSDPRAARLLVVVNGTPGLSRQRPRIVAVGTAVRPRAGRTGLRTGLAPFSRAVTAPLR